MVRPVGGGGMGDVYQAVDVETGSTVAAKVMRPTGEDPLDALLRFQQEGTVLSTLKHPNIVQVHGTFLEDQNACIIMEFLEGRDLSQILQSGQMPLDRVKRIGTQAAAALSYAHARGIIHRDVKPDNIMVAGDDHVKMTDFGIARVMRPGSVLNTAPGVSIGTPLYMAPEQIEGSTVDQRSDVYSLGVVLYHMLAGSPPFEGDTLLTIAFKHVHEAPHSLKENRPGLPDEWEAVVMRALAKNPDDRYQTAAELEEALSALDTREVETAAPAAAAVEPPGTQEPVTGANRTRIRAQPAMEVPRETSEAGLAPVGEALTPITTPPPAEPDGRSTVIRPGGQLVEADRTPAGRAPDSGPSSGQEPAARDGAPVATLPARPAEAPAQRRLPVWALAAAAGVVAVLVAVAFTALRPSSSPSKTASSPPIATWFPAHFQTPSGLTVDRQGAIYVADAGSNKIVKLSPAGKVVGTFGAGGGSVLLRPQGVAVDSRGNVYVADSGHDRVVQFSGSGKMLRTWPSSTSSSNRLHSPADVALGALGNIYVADTGDNLIQHLSASGSWQTPYSGFKHPSGIAVNSRASIFVADTGNNAVEELAWSTDLLNASTRGQFRAPGGIAIDGAGNVYVADTGNNRIVKLSSSFKTVKVWGGTGQLNQPGGVGVDGNGRIYVADTGNGRVGVLRSQ